MTDRELMQMALEALNSLHVNDYSGYEISKQETHIIDEAIEALRARLAQPEQSPTNNGKYLTGYTAPLQREWQGLTDDDFIGLTTQQIFAMKFAGAKLKEKNT